MELSKTNQTFILHWGEMGTRWGVNRTVAQIHALLMVSPQPLSAEEIADTLSVARSNVSNSIRELQSWGIIKSVHLLGDRKDHYTALEDSWETFRKVITERKQREIDPTLNVLRECLEELSGSSELDDVHSRRRLADIEEFLQTMVAGYDLFQSLSPAMVRRLVRAGDLVGLIEKGKGKKSKGKKSK